VNQQEDCAAVLEQAQEQAQSRARERALLGAVCQKADWIVRLELLVQAERP